MSPTREMRSSKDLKGFRILHGPQADRSGQERTSADKFRSSFVPHEGRSSFPTASLMLRGASSRWQDELPAWAARGTLRSMTDQALLGRITSNREIFGGKPIIRGMRVSVEMVVNLLAQGETAEAILDDHPGLEPDDIRACLAYAHAVLADDSLDAVQLAK